MKTLGIYLIFGFVLLLFISTSCDKKKDFNLENTTNELFTALTFEETGLNFNNKLTETTTENGFYYEYFYNGGGVAIADFNNDNLQDVYFISNMRTNKLFLNKGNLKFKNVSIKANAQGKGGFPTGVTVVDINNDGLKDIYILKSGRFENDSLLRNELLINKGVDKNNIPIFEERAKDYNLDLPHHSTQASFFDYDKDGDLDMFLINHNIDIYELGNEAEVMKHSSDKIGEKLYRNDNGTFINVTKKAGIISNNLGFGLGIAIGDVNNDGWPDVYCSNDYFEKDHLYLNNKNGTFKETSLKSFNHISTFSMGNDIADINNDGLLDILSVDMMSEDNYSQKSSMSGMNVEDFYNIENLGLHKQYMYNTLQLNNGNYPNSSIPVFSEVAELANISSTDWSWSPLLFDMDNDGNRDIFISNGIKRDFRNNDFLIYLEKKYQENATKKKVNLTKHIDDLLEKLPNRKKKNCFYLNTGNLGFKKIDFNFPETYSNGAAYADFDNDGDLDIVVNNVDDFATLYKNNQNSNSYIDIKLIGNNQNIDAIGSRISIKINNKKYIAENYFTRGFQSSTATPIHFGLGKNKKIDTIEVLWPDGKKQFVTNTGINKQLTISYAPNKKQTTNQITKKHLFEDITKTYDLQAKHQENKYNDFIKESLLPHKMSEEGPALAVADINNDGLDDFYLGGASGFSGKLYVQNRDGKFTNTNQNLFLKDKNHEDVNAKFLDLDGDQDLDLYVVSGGNEHEIGSDYYSDRIYINENGIFTKIKKPFDQKYPYSGSVIEPYDFDQDGDLDLFIGGRQLPGKYPFSGTSLLLRNDFKNGIIKFVNTKEKLVDNIGMVTDAKWVDIDGDKIKDLVIVGEWMPIKILKNKKGIFTDITKKAGLSDKTGWWFSIESADYDNDGDEDLIIGNLGLNSKYKASVIEPFEIFAKDFDNTGTLDIVLGYHQKGKLFPLRGRECSSNQMPFIKKKFPNYNSFASAELVEVYGQKNIDKALKYKATTFATTYLENSGDGTFILSELPRQAQMTAVRSIITEDINKDGNLDLLLFGNLYGFEVETPRQDAGYGLYLMGDGKGKFKALAPNESGLYVKGNIANTNIITLTDKTKAICIAKNNDNIQFIKIPNKTK